MRNFGAAFLRLICEGRSCECQICERQVRIFAREIARRLHRCQPLLRLFAPNGERNEIKSSWNHSLGAAELPESWVDQDDSV